MRMIVKAVMGSFALLGPVTSWIGSIAIESHPIVLQQFEEWRGKERMIPARPALNRLDHCGRLPDTMVYCCPLDHRVWIAYKGPISPYFVDKTYAIICLRARDGNVVT